MNSSLVNIESTGNGYEYTTYIFGVMFIISEILPLLKKKTKWTFTCYIMFNPRF